MTHGRDLPGWLGSLLHNVERAVPDIVAELWRQHLRELRRRGPAVAIKKGEHRRDLYTGEDRHAESFLRDQLRERIQKELGTISEEFTPTPESAQPGKTYWLIDAIDGTLNLSWGYPHFATSIALMHYEEPVYGCVYDPSLRELFTAVAGHGAKFGGETLGRPERQDLTVAIVAVGHGYDDARAPIVTELIRRLQPRVRAIRQGGCASLDLAYVAKGRVGCFVHPYLKSWDSKAGELLVRETGGVLESIPTLATKTTQGLIAANNSKVLDAVKAELDAARVAVPLRDGEHRESG